MVVGTVVVEWVLDFFATGVVVVVDVVVSVGTRREVVIVCIWAYVLEGGGIGGRRW